MTTAYYYNQFCLIERIETSVVFLVEMKLASRQLSTVSSLYCRKLLSLTKTFNLIDIMDK